MFVSMSVDVFSSDKYNMDLSRTFSLKKTRLWFQKSRLQELPPDLATVFTSCNTTINQWSLNKMDSKSNDMEDCYYRRTFSFQIGYRWAILYTNSLAATSNGIQSIAFANIWRFVSENPLTSVCVLSAPYKFFDRKFVVELMKFHKLNIS